MIAMRTGALQSRRVICTIPWEARKVLVWVEGVGGGGVTVITVLDVSLHKDSCFVSAN